VGDTRGLRENGTRVPVCGWLLILFHPSPHPLAVLKALVVNFTTINGKGAPRGGGQMAIAPTGNFWNSTDLGIHYTLYIVKGFHCCSKYEFKRLKCFFGPDYTIYGYYTYILSTYIVKIVFIQNNKIWKTITIAVYCFSNFTIINIKNVIKYGDLITEVPIINIFKFKNNESDTILNSTLINYMCIQLIIYRYILKILEELFIFRQSFYFSDQPSMW